MQGPSSRVGGVPAGELYKPHCHGYLDKAFRGHNDEHPGANCARTPSQPYQIRYERSDVSSVVSTGLTVVRLTGAQMRTPERWIARCRYDLTAGSAYVEKR